MKKEQENRLRNWQGFCRRHLQIGKMRDKTVIIVTHRRAALAICDYELHIEEGHMTRF